MAPLSTGDFAVGQKIGEGAFSSVFYGRLKHRESHQAPVDGRCEENPRRPVHRSVAIKVIDKVSIERHRGVRMAVLQEQRLLRRLTETTDTEGNLAQRRSASFVVPLLASFHDSQFLYMVMDCARGTLADIIQEHGVISKEHQDIPATSPSPLSTPPPSSSWLQTATRLAYQTLQAIEYIHKNEVIHCDIKPDNLLLSVQGRVQLCDFGSAVDLALRTANQDTPEPWRTAVPRGTSEYASPELLRGREDLTVETDLWSFGCVLFALFCSGRSPFYASSDALAVEKIVTFNIATSDILSSSHLPPVWKNLISVLLQQDPPRRWIDTTCASWASPSGLGVAPRPTALSDRYRSIKQHPIWGGVDCLEKALPDLLSKNMALMDEPFEALRDGKIGWSAFA